MARNPNRPLQPEQQVSDAQSSDDAAAPPMHGGTPGITPEASTTVHFDPGSALSTHRRPEPEGAVKSKTYRVVNGGNIMIGQCRTPVRVGKVIAEHEFDLDLLRRQGIILEEIQL